MAESVELQPLLEKIVAVTLVNGFCDFCTIHFPDGDDRITCRALTHKDPELTLQVKRVIERYSLALCAAAFVHCRGELLNDLSIDRRDVLRIEMNS